MPGKARSTEASTSSSEFSEPMEIAPRFVDLAVRRWQAFTGKDSIEINSGETFDDLAIERAPPAAPAASAAPSQSDQPKQHGGGTDSAEGRSSTPTKSAA